MFLVVFVRLIPSRDRNGQSPEWVSRIIGQEWPEPVVDERLWPYMYCILQVPPTKRYFNLVQREDCPLRR